MYPLGYNPTGALRGTYGYEGDVPGPLWDKATLIDEFAAVCPPGKAGPAAWCGGWLRRWYAVERYPVACAAEGSCGSGNAEEVDRAVSYGSPSLAAVLDVATAPGVMESESVLSLAARGGAPDSPAAAQTAFGTCPLPGRQGGCKEISRCKGKRKRRSGPYQGIAIPVGVY